MQGGHQTDFIIGPGHASSSRIQSFKRLGKSSNVTRISSRPSGLESMFSINGERFIEFFLKDDGSPTMRSIDPGTVYEIITEPGTSEKYTDTVSCTRRSIRFSARVRKARASRFPSGFTKPSSPTTSSQKLNIQDNEKRGRSDLLNILGCFSCSRTTSSTKSYERWLSVPTHGYRIESMPTNQR